MLFITQLQGSALTAAVRARETHLLQPEACYKGSQTKAARVQVAQTYTWPGPTLHQCARAEAKCQEALTGQESAPKRR